MAEDKKILRILPEVSVKDLEKLNEGCDNSDSIFKKISNWWNKLTQEPEFEEIVIELGGVPQFIKLEKELVELVPLVEKRTDIFQDYMSRSYHLGLEQMEKGILILAEKRMFEQNKESLTLEELRAVSLEIFTVLKAITINENN